jgi:uncharacterized protein YqhQ
MADGEIRVDKQPWIPVSQRHRLLNLPVLRGTPALIDAMIIGYRSLMLSADYAAESEGIKPPTTFQYALSIGFALVVTIGGFVLAPSAVIQRVGGGWLVNNVIEGLIRAAFFVGFILLASRMADMRRVFQYHGAEHKVINAFESTGKYSPDDAEPYGTLHQRCGTSFIFTVLVVGVLAHMLVGWPTSMAVRLGTRLLLLPLVAGVAYEIIRLAGRHKHSRVLSLLTAPGMWLQRITTQPPTPDMVEVAIRALEGALELDDESRSRGVARSDSPTAMAAAEGGLATEESKTAEIAEGARGNDVNHAQ